MLSESSALSPSLSVIVSVLVNVIKSSADKFTASSWFAASGWTTALTWSNVTFPEVSTATVNTIVSTPPIVT